MRRFDDMFIQPYDINSVQHALHGNSLHGIFLCPSHEFLLKKPNQAIDRA